MTDVDVGNAMNKALSLADAQAGFTHGWDDFRPVGLVFYRDGGIEAVRVANPAASVRDIALTTARAARADFRRVTAIGVICSAWASKQAVASETPIAPQDAPDRQRARLLYAVDVEGIAHTYTNVGNDRHHQQRPVRDCDSVLSVLAQALAEATFTSHFFCPSGEHERVMLL